MKQGFRIPVVAGVATIGAVGLWSATSSARTSHSRVSHSRVSHLRVTHSTKSVSSTRSTSKTAASESRFVSIQSLKALRSARAKAKPYALLPVLAPTWSGKTLAPQKPVWPGAKPISESEFQKITRSSAQRRRSMPSFPRSIEPARISTARVSDPRWVRYPLEFQLAGVGLGTLAVNKDRFNRIDRYGLFAMHGNPTAIVTPVRTAVSVGTGVGGAPGQTAASAAVSTLSVQQQPPEYSPRFANSQNGSVPAWANACLVDLDDNHVEWLYNRGTYAMGFVVDRLGYVDAIVVAGTQSDIANTQLEDPQHTIKLGDDLRKVLFRYGYPDSFTTDLVSIGGAAAPTAGGAEPGAGGGLPGAGGGPGAGAAASGGGVTNVANRIFEVRYEQSYNVVFTISYNRVVRIYIFGDPDYFNAIRRQRLRSQY